MKAVVLGFDGWTPDLAFPWAEAGLLPNLARVMRQGAWGSLRSVVHPITPAAWTSMITGVNPGCHGVFDFGTRREGSYDLRLVDSRDIRCPDLFQLLGCQDRSVAAFNIPLSFPPRPVRGVMVTGMHTPELAQGCHPPALAGEIKHLRPDYAIDVMSYWYDDIDLFTHEVFQMLDARREVALNLWERYRPDLFFAVFVAADRIQHALWKTCFPSGKACEPFKGAGKQILEVYRALDDALGAFLASLREDEVLFLVSDHGFGSLDKDVFLDRYLEDAGLLRFHRGSSRPDAQRRSVRDIDWSKTRAYSHGMFGNVYINRVGREPQGIVKPGPDCAQVAEEVAQLMASIRDPDDGQPLVDHALPGPALYRGEALDLAPDLVVIMRDYACMTRGGRELDGDRFVARPGVNHTGNHRLDGVLGIYGAGVAAGVALPVRSLMDLFPTLVARLGAKMQAPCDGIPIREAFSNATATPSSRQISRPRPCPQTRTRPASSPDGRTAVVRRLRALGYLE